MNSNFHHKLSYSCTYFILKIQPNTSEQEQKRQSIYDLFNTKTKPKFHCLRYTKGKIFDFKNVFKGKEERKIEQKMKRRCFFF